MNNKQIFKKYNSQLVREAILKSSLCGIISCFASVFVIALTCWLCDYNSIWLSLGIGVGVGVITAVACYFFKFRPTAKEVAERVDALGLEERMITMLELESDNSFMASLQREDANKTLVANTNTKIAFAVPLSIIISAIVLVTVGVAMFVVSVLAYMQIIPGGGGLFDDDAQFFVVTYEVDEGGEIFGESDQIIYVGEDAEQVQAVAMEGWIFVGWDDGNDDPYRQEFNVQEDMIISALFEQIDNEGDDPEEGSGNVGENGPSEGDADEEAASGEGGMDADGNGQTGEGGEGEGKSDDENDSHSNENGDKGQANGTGGKYDPNNQIIGNDTYYRDELEHTRGDINEELSSDDSEYSDEEKEFIEKYFGSI